MRALLLLSVVVFSLDAFAGGLRRETGLPLKTCRVTDGQLPVTHRYLRRLFAKLAAGNTETLTGDLSPQLLCVGAERNEASARAWADPLSRSFLIDTGLVLHVENDAQLAAVMAHELAHVTMRNSLCDVTPVVEGKAELVARQCEAERLVEERNELKNKPSAAARVAEIGLRLGVIEPWIHQTVAAAIGTEAAANWIEVEADEVGRQFHARAGFAADEFTFRHEQLVLWPPQGIPPAGAPMAAAARRQAAWTRCGIGPASAVIPERGVHRYAASCWSEWNLTVNPARPAVTGGTVTTVPGAPTLAEAKEEIRRLPPPAPVKPNR